MRKLSPTCSTTTFGPDPHEWRPASFNEFLKELEHIIGSCPENSPLFRGHADRRWLLESTFVRTCKKILLDLEPHITPSGEVRKSVEYHQALFGLLLLKYDVLVKPSQELEVLEKEQGIDALFELIKRLQQYPEEEYIFIKLILPDGTQKECEDYLNSQSPPITQRHLFPE